MLEPYSEVVAQRFAIWLKEQERLRGKPFTAEQLQWLTMIRDTIASSVTIETDDFDQSPFIQRGGLGKARQRIRARTAHNPTRLEREVSCMSEEKELPEGWVRTTLEYVVDICDNLRQPVNAEERSRHSGPYSYYGATGQVGWIDNYLMDGDLSC